MKVIDFLKNTDKTNFSIEIIPPLKGTGLQDIFENIEPLAEFNPPFINVTYHQEEVEYKSVKGGLLKKVIVKKRPGTVAMSAAIQNKFKIHVVPHIICGGASKTKIESDLIDLHFLGIENILALRGDPQKGNINFVPEEEGHKYSCELVKQITNLNQGKYLDTDNENLIPTNFSIGVAGYPEKHIEAANYEFDLINLKKKIEAGAEYIVTQMFFDNSKFFEFVKKCRQIGINCPIIPGIKPISTMKQIELLPKIFNVDIPEIFAKELRKCKSNKEVRQLGVEWGIEQSKELIKNNVPVVHYYTMGKSDNIKNIVKELF